MFTNAPLATRRAGVGLSVLHQRGHPPTRCVERHGSGGDFDLEVKGIPRTRTDPKGGSDLQGACLCAHPHRDRFIVQRLAGDAERRRATLRCGDRFGRGDPQEIFRVGFEGGEAPAAPRATEDQLGEATVEALVISFGLFGPARQTLRARVQDGARVSIGDAGDQRVGARILQARTTGRADP